MMTHWTQLLEQMVEGPDRRIQDLAVLSGEERERVIETWNRTDAPYRGDVCLHELFEAQADKTPDAVAVICGNEQLTYRELDERANYMAHALARLDIGRGDLAAICMDRSIDAIVALFGILK